MNTYELRTIATFDGDEVQRIVGIDGSGVEWWIPEDEANIDYQEYLKWLEENK